MPLTHAQALWTILGGTACVIASGAWLWSIENFREKAVRTNARVIELVRDYATGPEGGPSYKPRFQFMTPDGEVWTVTSSTGSSPSFFSVGDRVKVLYDPANPAKARIDSATQLWAGPVVLAFFAAVALYIGMKAL